MGRFLGTLYGVVAYVFFLAVFLYAIGFVGNLVVPKGIDSGQEGALGVSLLVNFGLLCLFALQHNIMARPWFKTAWTRLVPQQVERSTFVLLTNVMLALIFWQWRPATGVIWHIENETLALILTAISMVGWGVVLVSTFLIDHFDLFGLRQVFLWANPAPSAILGTLSRGDSPLVVHSWSNSSGPRALVHECGSPGARRSGHALPR